MKEFEKRVCYKLVMTLDSPLCIGSGRNDETDRDIIVDSTGRPFIPATSIAGVLRSALDENTARKIFGYIETERNSDENKSNEKYDSKIRIYDARMQDEEPSFYITDRDCVKLENKVGVKGAKFDMQAVETGAVFVSFIELEDAAYSGKTEELLAAVNSGELRFGSKTTRGYGRVKLKVYKKEIFSAEEWLGLGSLFDDGVFGESEYLNFNGHTEERIQIKLAVKCNGGISIREYSTDINSPDYETMGLHCERDNDKNKTPVIPGTSWSGAFRSRFTEIAGEESANRLFGFVDEKKGESAKSNIIFNESRLKDGVYKELTRNAIDRFSGATKTGALYTERTYYNGRTELDITVPAGLDEKSKFALAVCIADMNNGFMAVGGLTCVGRGLFTVTAVNGNEEIAHCLDADSVDIGKFIGEVFDK